eukprot:2132898-Amphidinium_carterae.1
MFRNDRRPRDIREVEDQIPKVIHFLEAWENVPKNLQPNWYRDALANYSIQDRIHWIFFEHGDPKEWMSPLPDASVQVVFAEGEAPITALPGTQQPQQHSAPIYIKQEQTTPTPSAAPTYIQQSPSDQGAAPAASAAASAAAPWQSYNQSGSQSQVQSDPAASAWQKPTGWQLNSGPQNWSAQSQAQSSSWQGSTYQYQHSDDQHQQPYWTSNNYTYSGSYAKNPKQGRSPYEALREGNFPKANFSPGKTRRMKPRARNAGELPNPEFEIKHGDESM